jgi:hypothetical protein
MGEWIHIGEQRYWVSDDRVAGVLQNYINGLKTRIAKLEEVVAEKDHAFAVLRASRERMMDEYERASRRFLNPPPTSPVGGATSRDAEVSLSSSGGTGGNGGLRMPSQPPIGSTGVNSDTSVPAPKPPEGVRHCCGTCGMLDLCTKLTDEDRENLEWACPEVEPSEECWKATKEPPTPKTLEEKNIDVHGEDFETVEFLIRQYANGDTDKMTSGTVALKNHIVEALNKLDWYRAPDGMGPKTAAILEQLMSRTKGWKPSRGWKSCEGCTEVDDQDCLDEPCGRLRVEAEQRITALEKAAMGYKENAIWLKKRLDEARGRLKGALKEIADQMNDQIRMKNELEAKLRIMSDGFDIVVKSADYWAKKCEDTEAKLAAAEKKANFFSDHGGCRRRIAELEHDLTLSEDVNVKLEADIEKRRADIIKVCDQRDRLIEDNKKMEATIKGFTEMLAEKRTKITNLETENGAIHKCNDELRDKNEALATEVNRLSRAITNHNLADPTTAHVHKLCPCNVPPHPHCQLCGTRMNGPPASDSDIPMCLICHQNMVRANIDDTDERKFTTSDGLVWKCPTGCRIQPLAVPIKDSDPFGEFLAAMRAKFNKALTKDDKRSKEPWVTYNLEWLKERLEDEWDEWQKSLSGEPPIPEGDTDELLDIANFCMFIWKRTRR